MQMVLKITEIQCVRRLLQINVNKIFLINIYDKKYIDFLLMEI